MIFVFIPDEKQRGYYLSSDYDPDFVADLKAEIPSYERKWDGPSKRWWVDRLAFEQAKAVAERYGTVIVRSSEPVDPQEQERRQRVDDERRKRDHENRQRAEDQERRRRERERRQSSTDGFTATAGNPYAVLCVTRDAPWPVVRAAYRALVAYHHPSSGHEGQKDEKKLIEVNLAYERIAQERGERK